MLISTSAQNVQDIGNIYQSVAHKLRKEKGQHLEAFMSTFWLSTGNNKQGCAKNSQGGCYLYYFTCSVDCSRKFEWAEIGDELDIDPSTVPKRNTTMPKTYRNHIFNDNFGVTFKMLKETSSSSMNLIGITECTFYLCK